MDALWLVHNGIPFDVAFSVGDIDRTAMAIVFSQFHGNIWNWDTMRFDPPER